MDGRSEDGSVARVDPSGLAATQADGTSALPSFTETETGAARSDRSLMYLVSGGLAGLTGDFLTHPLDTARARIQFQRTTAPDPRYTSTWATVKQTWTHEGVRGFYKGFGAVLLFTGPGHAAYFGGYDILKRVFYRNGEREAEQSPGVHFLSGVIANFFGGLIWNPQDVVKQRLQVQDNALGEPGRYSGSWHCLRSVYREEGLRGLYRGFWAQMLVYAPYVGIHFMLYEQSKVGMAAVLKRKPDELPAAAHLTGAMLTAMVAAYVTSPFDVVKTRLQCQSVNEGGYKGVIDALWTIGREEGPRAYFKGAGARALWLGPNSALCMAFYEFYKERVADAL